jgi:hypothetical protein
VLYEGASGFWVYEMAICELTDKCYFFNEYLPTMKAVAEGLKDMYCRGDNSECARLIVYNALGVEELPPELFPNEVEKGLKLIAQKQM